MTNKEKANEIAKHRESEFGETRDINGCCYMSALDMAEWKDEQIKEILKKKMDFFYPPVDDYNEGKLAILKDLYQELFNEYYI